METEIQVVGQKAVAILDQARAIVVTNGDEYVSAGQFILDCKSLAKEIQAFFKPMKDKAFAAHRAICDQENNTLKPVNQAIEAAGKAALPWKQEQDRLAAIEAERLRQEAIKKRETAKLKEAEVLEAFGDTDGAQAALNQAVAEPRRFKVESTVPKVAGLSTSKKWNGRIVAPSKVKLAYCLPDQSLINAKVQNFFAYIKDPTPEQIKALEEEIGGVEVYLDEMFAGRVSKGYGC